MIKPPHDWLTKPPAVAADGNPEMLQAIREKKTHPAGSGAHVVESLAQLYRYLGLNVALFESSQAAQNVTTRLMGQPNPDDVFTVDYCTGHKLQGQNGDPTHANIINNMTAATRLLEPYVMRSIAEKLGVTHVVTQPPHAKFEGGDFTFLPHAFGDQSLLVTGGGVNSRSNTAGHEWLVDTLQPDHHLMVQSSQFHRDLVSVFVQDHQGNLAQALLALECIDNKDQLLAGLCQLGVDVVQVPSAAVNHCAVNLLVNPGLLVGMQSDAELTDVLAHGLPEGVVYHSLPLYLQGLMKGFIDMQGGANCVSGHMMIEKGTVDLAPGHIAEINAHLHSEDFEDFLDATAAQLEMKEKIEAARAQQNS